MNFFARFKRILASKLIYYRLRIRTLFSAISVVPENILYSADLPLNTVIDCGCSSDAELATYMNRRYSSLAYCVDPTRKHSASLKKLERASYNIHYLQAAIAGTSGLISFYEPEINESGSIVSSHPNVESDTGLYYEVVSYNLSDLLNHIGLNYADYLKLDIEGAEYELISNTPPLEFRSFNQIFIEFHHHCLPSFSAEHTNRMVNKICSAGFRAVTFDRFNYLFIRQ